MLYSPGFFSCNSPSATGPEMLELERGKLIQFDLCNASVCEYQARRTQE